MIEFWAVNYKVKGRNDVFVKVFDSQTQAAKFANHPPYDVKIVGKIWEL